MPSKRAKNKVYLGGYVTRDLQRHILRLAKSEGMAHNKFGFIMKLVREALAQREHSERHIEASRPALTVGDTVDLSTVSLRIYGDHASSPAAPAARPAAG